MLIKKYRLLRSVGEFAAKQYLFHSFVCLASPMWLKLRNNQDMKWDANKKKLEVFWYVESLKMEINYFVLLWEENRYKSELFVQCLGSGECAITPVTTSDTLTVLSTKIEWWERQLTQCKFKSPYLPLQSL